MTKPDHAADDPRIARIRDEIAGLLSRLDALERSSSAIRGHADTVESRLADRDSRQEAHEQMTEGLSRSSSAVLQRLDGEVARSDRLDDLLLGLERRIDGLETQLLQMGGRADGNAAALEEVDKRLTVVESAVGSTDLRLGILESRDENSD